MSSPRLFDLRGRVALVAGGNGDVQWLRHSLNPHPGDDRRQQWLSLGLNNYNPISPAIDIHGRAV
jgi:hypothetical protein